MGSTEKDCQQAAEWAEHDMTVKPASATALRGEAAATFGRDLLERANVADARRSTRRRDQGNTPRCGRFGCRPR